MIIPIECLPLLLALHCSSWGLQQRRHKGMRHSSYAIRTVQLGKWLPCCSDGHPYQTPKGISLGMLFHHVRHSYMLMSSLLEGMLCKNALTARALWKWWTGNVMWTPCVFFQCTRICEWQQNKTLFLADVRIRVYEKGAWYVLVWQSCNTCIAIPVFLWAQRWDDDAHQKCAQWRTLPQKQQQRLQILWPKI